VGAAQHLHVSPPTSKPKANTGTRTCRLPWADLLKKVFAVARRIHLHLGLDSRGPPVARAQAPPDFSELVQIILDQRAQIP